MLRNHEQYEQRERDMEQDEDSAEYAAFLAGMDLFSRGYMLKSIANPFARAGWLTAQSSQATYTPSRESGWAKYENGQPEGDCTPGAERNGWYEALYADATMDMPIDVLEELGI